MRTQDNVLKYMAKTDNGFFSPMKILSYGRPANIITGHRSGGKSTGVGRFVLFDFILNKRKFLYIRRRRDELDKTKKKFFDNCIDIINKADLGFKIVYFDCEAGRYKMTINYDDQDYTPVKYNKDGDKEDMTPEEEEEARKKDIKSRAVDCGGAIALAMSQKVKSGYDFSDTDTIIFDEFIAEHQTDYLGSAETPDVEYENLISLFVSCDRGIGKYFRNETRIILIGNKANVYNPILLKWNVNKYLTMSPEAKFIAPKGEPGWVYEQVDPSQAFVNAAKNSNAILLMDEQERDYNLGNKTRAGNEGAEWIQNPPPKANYYKGIILAGNEYGIYQYNNIMFIGKYQKGKRASAYDIVSLSRNDANLIVTNWKQDPIMLSIYIKFCRKQLYFNNQDTARVFLQYLNFIPK